MDIRIKPQKLHGSVEAIPSKSAAHRLLIAAALADKPTKIHLGTPSRDIQTTVTALRRMGTQIEEGKNGDVTVYPIEEMPCTRTIDCGESGSTLRFLFPLAAALGCNGFTYTGSPRLAERPMEPLIEVMRRHGVLIRGEKLPYRVSGQLHGGIYKLPGNVSSQFLTGLLFALPLLIADSRIVLTTEAESMPYVDLTIGILNRFGVTIKRDGNRFDIKGRQQFRSPGEIDVEKDWSNAAFWLAAGALGDEISVSGISRHSRQGDKAIVDLIEEMAGKEKKAAVSGITVRHQTLSAIDIDAAQIPDLVPILAVLACAAKGKTTIYNAAKLRTKESDRLRAMRENLSALGADIEESEDGLIINGGKKLKGGTVEGFNDHRIVMAMAVASLLCDGELTINGSEAVAKSYPAFFDDFKALGGSFDVL